MNPSPDHQKNRKVKISLLSGFLGSGKTTLLKRLLSWEADLAGTVVIVNEFGKVGIDGALLKETGSDVIELASGCICCTLQVDLKQTIKQVCDRLNPRQILIEASGLADPSTIVTVIHDPDIHKHAELKKIITVLDCECWKAREAFGTVFYNQLNLADLILLNKIDLVKKDEIQPILKEIHHTVSGCRVVPTVRCRIDSETIGVDASGNDSKLKLEDFTGLNLIAPGTHEKHRPQGDKRPAENHAHDAEPDDIPNYMAFSFQDPRALDETCFKRFLGNLPWELFRLKGPVRFKDRSVLINFVGGKGDWETWRGAPETSLTFIGWDVDENDIIKRLKKCLIELSPGQPAD